MVSRADRGASQLIAVPASAQNVASLQEVIMTARKRPELGRTWWEAQNSTSRDPISLVNLDLSLQGECWTIKAWSKNLTNQIYNAEFSPGGFLWRALPRRYGLDFAYRF
jgi:iron complex outermembrane receptor protein